MLRRVCILTSYNLYESKRYFSHKLAEALQRQGVEVKIIDTQGQTKATKEFFESISSFAPNFTCSFNSTFPFFGRFFWDVIQIPHLTFLVDPFLYSTILTMSPYSLLSCVDRHEYNLARSLGFHNTFFWPHAVEKELGSYSSEEKQYDIVFMGTSHDCESLREEWHRVLPTQAVDLIEEAISLIFNDDGLSLDAALNSLWEKINVPHPDTLYRLCYRFLDKYTRGKDRLELIRSIKDIPIHIFGERDLEDSVGQKSWKELVEGQTNVVVHSPLSFTEAMGVLKQSKFVLNSMPFFRDGTHERVFAAFACGCIPVTSESRYLREEFRAGEEILFYSTKNRAAAGESIQELLKNEKRRQEVAAVGREKVMQRHTWDHRAKELMEKVPPLLVEVYRRATIF